MRFVDPDSASTDPRVVRVTEIHIRPDGCRNKVHVNRSECYDYGTEVTQHGVIPKGLITSAKSHRG